MDVLITAIVAWIIAQLIKFVIEFAHSKKLKLSLLWTSGGMPSAHTAFVIATTVKIGLAFGVMSPIFGVCAVFSLVVMYDAVGVRKSVGQQAQAINDLQFHINKISNLNCNVIKEVCGHTVPQVIIGFFIGIIVPFII